MRTGITGSISLDGKSLTGGWTTHCLPLDAHSFSKLNWEPATATVPAGPTFYKAEFDSPGAMDTFLATKGWTKGIACASLSACLTADCLGLCLCLPNCAHNSFQNLTAEIRLRGIRMHSDRGERLQSWTVLGDGGTSAHSIRPGPAAKQRLEKRCALRSISKPHCVGETR